MPTSRSYCTALADALLDFLAFVDEKLGEPFDSLRIESDKDVSLCWPSSKKP